MTCVASSSLCLKETGLKLSHATLNILVYGIMHGLRNAGSGWEPGNQVGVAYKTSLCFIGKLNVSIMVSVWVQPWFLLHLLTL